MDDVMIQPRTRTDEVADLRREVESIHLKLDVILEEIELQRRHRREMEDLKADLMRVGKDLYDSTVLELEEIHDHVETADIVHLIKKLARNINNLNLTIERLESTQDFLTDFGPISRELVIDTMGKLDEMDRKGYFEFLRELTKIADNVVTSFSPEDVRKLGDNIVTILETVKNLSQKDVLGTVNNALAAYRSHDIELPDRVSTWSLLRELSTPEMRRSLLYLIRFQKSLVMLESQNTPAGPAGTI